MSDVTHSGLLHDLDTYFDAAPRWDADAVDAGAFTLFVGRSAFGYYARPAVDHLGQIGVDDLAHLASVSAEHEVACEIEWVHETRPELAAAAAAFGLATRSHALMAAAASDIAGPVVDGVALRVIDPDDPAVVTGRAVASVSFAHGGTAVGGDGPERRNEAALHQPPALIAHLRERVRRGRTVTAVAETDEGVIATGSYRPVDGRAELLAVATLPSARRRGVGGALTAFLAQHAIANGVDQVLLSAQDEDVARVYERVGFRRVGSTGAAEQSDS